MVYQNVKIKMNQINASINTKNTLLSDKKVKKKVKK